jgi:hypothetical protein
MVTAKLYKPNGIQVIFNALSDKNAISIAYQKYSNMGLIGRYYLETSNGGVYQITL